MLYLHIDPKNNENHLDSSKYNIHDTDLYNEKLKLTDLFNKYKDNGKQMFVLVYMEGCGPCGMTRPEWNKIKNVMKGKYGDNVVIADFDQELLSEIKGLNPVPNSYPTICYINGSQSEDYEDSDIETKDRSIDSFVKWIDTKVKQNGGARRKRKNKSKSKKRKMTKRRTRHRQRRYTRK